MAIRCPECDEKIPGNSEECPECGAEIDASLRVNHLRVIAVVISLSLILFVAVPSILKTIFASDAQHSDLGEAKPLEEIKQDMGGEQVLKILDFDLQREDGEAGEVLIRWRVAVENRSTSPILFDADLRFLDSEGVEARNEYRLETAVKGSSKVEMDGSFSLPKEQADRITNLRAIVQPSDVIVPD